MIELVAERFDRKIDILLLNNWPIGDLFPECKPGAVIVAVNARRFPE